MSKMIYSERTGSFMVLILFCAIVYYTLKTTKIMPRIRSLPAMDAVEEAVGRAAEMGRPLFYTTGIVGLTSIEGPIAGAAMSILGHTARLTAKYGVSLNYFLGPINLVPVAQDIIKTAYTLEGMEDEYSDEMVRWLSESQMVYCTAFTGACERERPATHIMMGGFWYESILLGEAGRAVNAFTVGGTPRQGQIHFLVSICDYVLIGEEFFAAAAKITDDRDEISSILGGDYIKMILIFLLIAGSVLEAVGIDFLTKILSL